MATITPTLLTHDILLGDGTTTLGLFIVKDKNGIPAFQIFPAQSLANQQYESYSEAIFPPQYQGFGTQKTWHGGFGKQQYVANRYLQAIGADASTKGLIIPGPVAVATTNTTPTYASTATIANGGFDSDITSWTVVTEGDALAWASQGTTKRTGAGAARVDSSTATTPEIKQKLVAADSSLFNTLQITVSCYGFLTGTSTNTTLQVILKDGSGTQIAASSATTLNAVSWTEVTVTHTFTDGWPALWVHLKFVAASTNPQMYIDDVTVTLTGSIGTATNMGTIVRLIDFNSNHYAVSDTGVWKRTTNNWARIAGSPDAITDAETDGTDLYLARGTSKNYWYMASGETFTRNTGTGASSQPIKLLYFNGSMYGTDDPQTVWKYSTLSSGAFSPSYTIGDIGQNITAAVVAVGAAAEAPFFIKEGGAAYINASGTVVPIASELKSLDNTNTGKNSIAWRGNGAQTLYMPTGAGATLLAYDAGDVVNVGPDAFAERLSDFTGQVVATASDDQWLYVIQDNGAKIEILKGRYETIDGVTDFRWHPFFEDTYATVAGAHISSITAKRLYYWGSTTKPSYIPLPTKYGDPLNDTNLTFLTGKTFETSWIDEGLPNIPKTYLSFTLSSTSLSGTARTVKVEYQLWESQSWTELGGDGNGTFNISPTQTKSFAATIEGRKIRFRFTLNTDNSANGLGILQFTYRYALKPPRLLVFSTRVIVSDRNVFKNSGGRDTLNTYGVVASQLRSWRDTQPLTLTYFDGQRTSADGSATISTAEVKFLDGYPKDQFLSLGNISSQAFESPEGIFELMMVNLDRTVS